jgi:hypothetical protein
MNREAKTKLRQILKKLDQALAPNSRRLEVWFSSWSELLPKKLGRLGELLQVLLSICVTLPIYAIAVALFTLFLLISSLIATFLSPHGRRSWVLRVSGSKSKSSCTATRSYACLMI